jgi:hypothetical protein
MYIKEPSVIGSYNSDLVSLDSSFFDCRKSFTAKWSQRSESFRRNLNSEHCGQGVEYVSSSMQHLVNAPGEIP